MANRIVLNQISYHGKGAIEEIANEAKARRLTKAFVCTDPDLVKFGVTQKVLTQQLRAMEESGLLTRKVYAEVPPRVEYTLTGTGRSLKPILDAMVSWGESYKETLERQS